MFRTENTIYELNANGTNLWSASVQAGKDDNDNRTPDKELEGIAVKLSAVDDLVFALKVVLEMVDNDIIQCKPSDREEFISVLRIANAALQKTEK